MSPQTTPPASYDIAARFAPFEAKMRAERLSEIVIDNFRAYYYSLVGGSTGLIPEASIQPVAAVPDMAETDRYTASGRANLRSTAVLKLNGGLGTSMGLDKAKSLLIARDDLSFLDVIARQVLSFSYRHDCQVPLILMNSFSTEADSCGALERYPELRGDIPLSLMQNKVPKVLRETLDPAIWPADPELEWCPPGHGEVYIALATTGTLDLLLARGYKYLFISNADNLGATLDLGILGYVAAQKLPFLMEVADRTEADKKGGHLAQRPNGQLILREVAQCPKEDLSAFQDIERHRYFNTNNIWINLVRLKATLEDRGNVLPLPMIRNAKTLDPKDEQSPPVYQLETAMGAAIAVFPGARALRVPRERFLPVKLCSDLLALRSDAYILEANYSLRPNPARRNKPLTVDLDPEYYQYITDFEARFPGGPPSLVACSRLAVRGDVVFEAGVICKGAVQVANPGPDQRRIPSGTVIADTTFEAR